MCMIYDWDVWCSMDYVVAFLSRWRGIFHSNVILYPSMQISSLPNHRSDA